MIIHDNSDTAIYFAKGLDYVNSTPLKKKSFSLKKNESKKEASQVNEYITIIGTTRKESIDFIANVISQKQSSGFAIDQILIVILDYFKDSMIRSKYIKGKLLRGNKTKLLPVYIFVEFNELDKIIQIEDEYNQSFSYKGLSRHYKKQLQLVHEYSGVTNNIEEASKIRKTPKKGGNDFANSTMV